MAWQPRELVVDAFRNLGWLHLIVFATATLSSVGAAVFLNSQAASSLQQQADLLRSGVTVWSVQADENQTLDAATCIDLARGEGVDASGAFYPSTPTSATIVDGGAQLQVVYVTPGLLEVFDPTAVSLPSVGAELVDTGAVSVGQSIQVDGAAVRLAQILPAWTPVSQLSAGISIPRLTGAGIAECWVRMSSHSGDLGVDVLQAAFGAELRVSRLAPPVATSTPWQQWLAVAGIYPSLVAGLAAGLVSAAMHWARRPEYALRRVLGLTAAQVAALCGVEAALILTPAFLLAAGSALWLAVVGIVPATSHTVPLVVASCASSAALTWALLTILALPAARSQPIEALRDR